MEMNMTKGSPFGMILRFAIPLFLGNIFQQLYNMIDSVIVGKYVGANALAAVGSTGTIFFLVIGLAMGMASGFTVMTSQYYGAKDWEGVRYSVTNGIIMSLCVSGVLTTVSILVMPGLLGLMNTPEEIYDDAFTYIIIICSGTVAIIFYNLFSFFMRAIGNSRIPLYFLIFSACTNVVLDLLFIIVFKWGVAGAAWATVAAQGLAGILCAGYTFAKIDVLRPTRKHWKMKKECYLKQLSIGIPMSLETGITASGTIVMQAAVNVYGATAVAGFTAASKIQMLLTQGLLSIGQTMASYSGQNYGAGKLDRISEGVRDAMIITVVYSVSTALVGWVFFRQVIQIFFSADVVMEDVLPWAQTYYLECATFFIPLGMIFIFRSTVQGCGYGVHAMLMGVLELVGRVIMALVSIKVGSYALACFADPAAWLLAGVFGAGLYAYLMKKEKGKREGETLQGV